MIFPLLLAVFLGFCRMDIALNANQPVGDFYSVEYTGKVVSDPVYNPETERIICRFKLLSLDGMTVDDTVRLYIRSDTLPLEGVEYGQTLRVYGHVWPQDEATNPYQFDSRKWLLSDGMTGMAAAKLEDTEVLFCSDPDINSLIISIRKAISDRIDTMFPENPELVRAFVLGDRSKLDTNVREQFSRTGITHLICISGMHISVLATALLYLLRRILSRNVAVITTIAIVIFYGFLIGFPASLIRATVMFSVFSIAPLTGRYSDSVTRLAVAFLGMLIVHPFYIYDSGFALSFAASAGIILLDPPIEILFGVDRLRQLKPLPNAFLNCIRKILIYFPSLLCSTLAAQIATLPIVVACFGAQSLVSIPANLLAIPLAMIAYPLSLVGLLMSSLIPAAGSVIALASDGLFSALLWIVGGFARIPIAEMSIPRYPMWLSALHCALIVGASDLTKISTRIRRWFPVCTVSLACISLFASWVCALPFQVTFLDAGQADASVLRAEGKTWLFDVGDLYTPAADYVSAVSSDVDGVFLSHPHYDHAAGLVKLIEVMKPDVIYVPEGWFDVEISDSVLEGMQAAENAGIPIVELAPDTHLQLSGNVSVFVHRTNGNLSSINDMSLVLEVRYYETEILFTGDISRESEPDFIPDIDILKVPHHGSSTGTSPKMLEAASPQISIISVGENSYGHPSDETVRMLQECGSRVLRTDHSGAITILAEPDGTIHIDTYLNTEEFP